MLIFMRHSILPYLMMTPSNGNIFRVTGPFVRGIHRTPVNSAQKGHWRGALMFSLICALNKQLSKESWGWWFEMLWRPLWRHCNVTPYFLYLYIRITDHWSINVCDCEKKNEKKVISEIFTRKWLNPKFGQIWKQGPAGEDLIFVHADNAIDTIGWVYA